MTSNPLVLAYYKLTPKGCFHVSAQHKNINTQKLLIRVRLNVIMTSRITLNVRKTAHRNDNCLRLCEVRSRAIIFQACTVPSLRPADEGNRS